MGTDRAAGAAVTEPEQLRLFEFVGVPNLEALRMERAAIAEGKRSAATRRAYACDWQNFTEWCMAAGRRILPASADTVSLYLVHRAQAGKAVSTIGREAAAIAARHLAAGEASPVTPDVREVMAGIRRKLGTEPKHAKAALTVEELRAAVRSANGSAKRGPYEWELPGAAALVARDRAVLLIGFASGFRRSELAALDLADVQRADRGLVLHLGRSKTDQEGAGRKLGIARGRRASTCPVRAFDAWLVERGRWPGPLFCGISRAGAITRKRLSGASVAWIVKAAAARAGLDPSRYGGHSLRAGMATAAAANGSGDAAIMQRTGHRSTAMVRRYVRDGTLFAVDPLRGVL